MMMVSTATDVVLFELCLSVCLSQVALLAVHEVTYDVLFELCRRCSWSSAMSVSLSVSHKLFY